MRKVCTQTSTGKFIIAMDDHEGVIDTLRTNAVNWGFDPQDLSFTDKTEEEVEKIVDDLNKELKI